MSTAPAETVARVFKNCILRGAGTHERGWE